MSSTIIRVFSAVHILAFLCGLITNGFVLGVNIWNQKQSVPLTKSDFYMCYLAITNLSLHIWTTAKWICNNGQENDFICSLRNALKMTSSSCSLLLTASLCMFYCSRIVVFRCCFFRWVQKHVIHKYQYLIIVSVLFCVAMGLPLAWTTDVYKNTSCIISSAPCNQTLNEPSYTLIYRSVIMLFGYAIPLFYVILSAGLILWSLVHHIRRMHMNMRKGHEIRMEAHIQAGCTVLSLLLLFSVYFVISVLLLTDVVPQDSPFLHASYLAPMLYSTVHGFIMIKGNIKLRKAARALIKKLAVIIIKTYLYIRAFNFLTQHL
ncbi:taste receptor type 2 member 40-like [Anomaloglossus baeobatrachus]